VASLVMDDGLFFVKPCTSRIPHLLLFSKAPVLT
jgi:hypothetical protein